MGESCMHLLCHPPRTVLAGLKVKETKAVYEGEVTELTPTEAENPLSGYGKTVSHVIVGLKTVRGTKQLRLDPSIYEACHTLRVVHLGGTELNLRGLDKASKSGKLGSRFSKGCPGLPFKR